MPIPLAISAAGLGAAAEAIGIKPARLRSRAANDRIRFGMVDAAAKAALAGQETVTVTNPGGRRETGAPLAMLQAWEGTMASAAGRQYAADVWASLERAYGPFRVGQGTIRGAGGATYGGSAGVSKGEGVSVTVGGKKKPKASAGESYSEPPAASRKKKKSSSPSGRGRQYVRYNPSTGEKVKVYSDEPEYDAWPNKKPRSLTSSRGRRTESGRQIDRLTSQVTRDALKGGIRLTAKAAGAIGTLAAGAGISVAALTAIVLAAGAASFFGTSWIIKKLGEARAQRAAGSDIALAYREARARMERQEFGRAGSPPGSLLDPVQHKALAEMFKAALRERGIPTTGVR